MAGSSNGCYRSSTAAAAVSPSDISSSAPQNRVADNGSLHPFHHLDQENEFLYGLTVVDMNEFGRLLWKKAVEILVYFNMPTCFDSVRKTKNKCHLASVHESPFEYDRTCSVGSEKEKQSTIRKTAVTIILSSRANAFPV